MGQTICNGYHRIASRINELDPFDHIKKRRCEILCMSLDYYDYYGGKYVWQAYTNNLEAIKWYVASDDLFYLDNMIDMAIEQDHIEIVKCFLSANTILDVSSKNARIGRAIRYDRLDILKYLLTNLDGHAYTVNHILCAASFFGSLDIVRYSLSLGADVNCSERPLYNAMYFGSIEIAKILLDLGADHRDPELIDDACLFGRKDIIRLLLSRGVWHTKCDPYDYIECLVPEHIALIDNPNITRILKKRFEDRKYNLVYSDIIIVAKN